MPQKSRRTRAMVGQSLSQKSRAGFSPPSARRRLRAGSGRPQRRTRSPFRPLRRRRETIRQFLRRRQQRQTPAPSQRCPLGQAHRPLSVASLRSSASKTRDSPISAPQFFDGACERPLIEFAPKGQGASATILCSFPFGHHQSFAELAGEEVKKPHQPPSSLALAKLRTGLLEMPVK